MNTVDSVKRFQLLLLKTPCYVFYATIGFITSPGLAIQNENPIIKGIPFPNSLSAPVMHFPCRGPDP